MIGVNRREFLQASTAPFWLDSVKISASRGGRNGMDAVATAFVRTEAGEESWTIGNTLVEREIHYDAPAGL